MKKWRNSSFWYSQASKVKWCDSHFLQFFSVSSVFISPFSYFNEYYWYVFDDDDDDIYFSKKITYHQVNIIFKHPAYFFLWHILFIFLSSSFSLSLCQMFSFLLTKMKYKAREYSWNQARERERERCVKILLVVDH